MIKSINNLKKQEKDNFNIPKSIQQVIPIQRIWTDGIFLVGKNKYSQTFKFSDINYAVASKEDKEAMFLEYGELLNSFDSGATTKITIALRRINKKDFEDEISAWHESGRPKLLWTPRWSTDKSIGGSHFFDYKDDLIEVAEKGYCNLIIRPHPLMFSNFVKTGEMTKEEYITFCKMCKEKNVLIDLSEVYLRTFIDTDILITDLSSIVQEFFVLGKPIVYCPPSADVHQTKTMKKIVSACYIVNDSIELNTVLMNLLRGDDILFDKRKKVFDELFGETIDCSCELITDFLIEDFGGKV